MRSDQYIAIMRILMAITMLVLYRLTMLHSNPFEGHTRADETLLLVAAALGAICVTWVLPLWNGGVFRHALGGVATTMLASGLAFPMLQALCSLGMHDHSFNALDIPMLAVSGALIMVVSLLSNSPALITALAMFMLVGRLAERAARARAIEIYRARKSRSAKDIDDVSELPSDIVHESLQSVFVAK